MTYDPHKHHRRSIRLKGYDYARAGAYFITICTQDRACLFGEVVDGEMRLNALGMIVADTWQWLGNQYDYVELDAWVIMPNHLHGIIVITNDGRGGSGRGGSGRGGSGRGGSGRGGSGRGGSGRGGSGRGGSGRGGSRTAPTGDDRDFPTKRKPIGRLVGAFKTVSTKHINEHRQTPGMPVWQRNYYEHIIRDDGALQRIRAYIAANPLRWHHDRENPTAQEVTP